MEPPMRHQDDAESHPSGLTQAGPAGQPSPPAVPQAPLIESAAAASIPQSVAAPPVASLTQQPPTGHGFVPLQYAQQPGYLMPNYPPVGYPSQPAYPPQGQLPPGYPPPPSLTAPDSKRSGYPPPGYPAAGYPTLSYPRPGLQGDPSLPAGWPTASTVAAKSPALSIVSLVAAIIGFVLSFPTAAIGALLGATAVVLGFLARRSEPRAQGLWLTSIIVGFVAVAFALLAFAVVLAIQSTRGAFG